MCIRLVSVVKKPHPANFCLLSRHTLNVCIERLIVRYATLRRSAKEQQLVLVIDEKTEALAQSVSMLDQNGDIMTV